LPRPANWRGGQKHKLVACLPAGRAREQKILLGCGAKGNFLRLPASGVALARFHEALAAAKIFRLLKLVF